MSRGDAKSLSRKFGETFTYPGYNGLSNICSDTICTSNHSD